MQLWAPSQYNLRFALGDFYFGQVAFSVMLPQFGLAEILNAEYPDIPAHAELVFTRPVHPPKAVEGYIQYTIATEQWCYIDMEGRGFEDYIQKFSAKQRGNFKRAAKAFSTCREHRQPDELNQFAGIASHLSRRTWQHSIGSTDSDALARKILNLADSGTVRGFTLWYEGQAVAFAFCRSFGRTLIYDTIGYDPAFKSLSPGVGLLFWLLRLQFENQEFAIFDFGPGNHPYKHHYASDFADCYTCLYFSPSARARTAIAAHRISSAISLAAGTVLEKSGAKEFVKGLLRRAQAMRGQP